MPTVIIPIVHMTKKYFKWAMEQKQDMIIDDPSVVAPFHGLISEYMKSHKQFTVTTEKRKWFAEIDQRDEKLIVK